MFANSTDLINAAIFQTGNAVSIGGTASLGALTLIGNVPGNDAAGMALYNQGGGPGASVSLDMYNTTYNGGIPQAKIKAIDDGNYSDHLTFWTKTSGGPNNAVTEKVRITSSGNVGIGTANPSQKLEVAGTARFDSGVMFGDGTTQTTATLTGPQGPQGATGAAGTAATISVGTTTTGAAGASASVTNSGTTSAAVLNFTIPQGATGPQGPTGPAGYGNAEYGYFYNTSTIQLPVALRFYTIPLPTTGASTANIAYNSGVFTLSVSGDYAMEYDVPSANVGPLTCGIFLSGTSSLLVAGSQNTGAPLTGAHHSFITSVTAPFSFELECQGDIQPGSISPQQPGDTVASLQIIKLK
jgi:hypothetical protein